MLRDYSLTPSFGTESFKGVRFACTYDIQRGSVRNLVVTAADLLDISSHGRSVGARVEPLDDLARLTEALCIEAAVMYSDRPLPQFEDTSIKWLDRRSLPL